MGEAVGLLSDDFGQKYDRSKTVAITGHRPHVLRELLALPFHSSPELLIMKPLESLLDRAIERGYRNFIFGMADGVDIWASEIILERRSLQGEINGIGAIPFLGHESRWSSQSRDRLGRSLANLQDCYVVSNPNPEHLPRSDSLDRRLVREMLMSRNRWMVDRASLILGICSNKRRSGTSQCLDYAAKNGVKACWFDPLSGRYNLQDPSVKKGEKA